MKPEERLEIGVVGRPHGIRGEITIRPDDPDGKELAAASGLLFTPGPPRELAVKGIRRLGEYFAVTLKGVADRDAAAAFSGARVSVRRSDLPPLDENENFVADLIGLDVIDADTGTSLGRLAEVCDNAAQDCFVIQGAAGEVILPVLPEVVLKVDLDAKAITVRPPEGLLEIYRSEQAETPAKPKKIGKSGRRRKPRNPPAPTETS